MADTILFSIFFLLFFIGYIIVVMTPELLHKHEKKTFKLYKRWFLISQGAALSILLYMMTTERNLIPLIGFIVLLTICCFSGITAMAGWIIPPNERSARGKKLLKLSYWIVSSGLVLIIVWAIFWWKNLFP